MQYYKKPNSVNISQINNNYNSFHPADYRVPLVPDKSYKTLIELCEEEDVGQQIDVDGYLSFDTNYYLQTISCMEGVILDEKKGENISPLLYKSSEKKLKKGYFCISRNASVGKISYVYENINAIVNGGISYFSFKEKYKYYVPAFFITNYGEDILKCLTSGGGTQQNVKRSTLSNMKIPFPNPSVNNTQDEIIEYVSDLVKALINKEIMIKQKVDRINKIIDKEMSKYRNEKPYLYPSIKEIKNSNARLDTGVYKKGYKDITNNVLSYPQGSCYIKSMKYKWVSGKTPDIAILNNKGKYWWIAVGDISYGLKYKTASPQASVTDDIAEQAHKVPYFIVSIGGYPKPSLSVG